MVENRLEPEKGDAQPDLGFGPMKKFAAGRKLVQHVSATFLIASLIGIFTYGFIAFWYEVSTLMAIAVFLLTTALVGIVLLPKSDD